MEVKYEGGQFATSTSETAAEMRSSIFDRLEDYKQLLSVKKGYTVTSSPSGGLIKTGSPEGFLDGKDSEDRL